jgi:putative glutamine amidotransferase
MVAMTVRIAIPEPTSSDASYNRRSLPPYLDALRQSGAEPVVILLDARPETVARLLAEVQGVVLPGSPFDIDPQIYGEARIPECAAADPGRTATDELLLQDAFNLHKPILAICYGVQALNVWRNGTLIQDLEAQLGTPVNHRPGRDVQKAHPVDLVPESGLAELAALNRTSELWVNSSHHQAIRETGDNLKVVAVSPVDGVIEAMELDSAGHFVLGIQWHPERSFASSALSRAIFAAFVGAASTWEPRQIEDSVTGR